MIQLARTHISLMRMLIIKIQCGLHLHLQYFPFQWIFELLKKKGLTFIAQFVRRSWYSSRVKAFPIRFFATFHKRMLIGFICFIYSFSSVRHDWFSLCMFIWFVRMFTSMLPHSFGHSNDLIFFRSITPHFCSFACACLYLLNFGWNNVNSKY